MSGIKTIIIQAATTYPIVSAWEYETLKTEKVVLDRMKACTIYIVMQRPLTTFDRVELMGGGLMFDLVDGLHPPLKCFLPLARNGLVGPDGKVEVELGFHEDRPRLVAPFKDVAAIKLRCLDGSFIAWFSPQKFLYEVICGNLQAQILGNPLTFSEYEVHYIGQAFNQEVWKRLTGHEKLQSILIRERPMGDGKVHAPMEISIAMLTITGFNEVTMIGPYKPIIDPNVKPIEHPLTTAQQQKRFAKTWVELGSRELTNEVEAILIHQFRPKYNKIMFDKYPYITRGTRSKGYTSATLSIERLPVILKTAHCRQEPVL